MFEVIITSSMLIAVLTLLRRLWRGRISPGLQYAMWLIAAIRLLVPAPVFGNSLNVMNLVYYILEAAEERAAEHAEPTGTEAAGYSAYSPGMGAEQTDREIRTDFAPDAISFPGQEKGPEPVRVWTETESGEESAGHAAEAGVWSVEKLVQYTWYGGAGILAVWMISCNVLFRRRLCRERVLLGRRGRIRIYVAGSLESPCLCGLFVPAVYLTAMCLKSEQYREHAIAHELTHYRHGDHIWILVRNLCIVLYWFNPLVWLAAVLSARDGEAACDEGTVRRLGEGQRTAYGCTLIEMIAGSGEKWGMLRCTADLSCRKKEIKERITLIAAGRKRTGIALTLAVVCCGMALSVCTFGGAKEREGQGRYVEAEVELPESMVQFTAMVQEGKTIRLVDGRGADLLSENSGGQFSAVDNVFSDVLRRNIPGSITGVAADPEGGRAVTWADGEQRGCTLFSHDGIMAAVSGIGSAEAVFPYYCGGSFYVSQSDRVYRLDSSGNAELLLDGMGTGEPCCLASDGKLLYVMYAGNLVIYDLERRTVAGQDPVLEKFLKDEYIYRDYGLCGAPYEALLYPDGEDIFLLDNSGIYRHTLYGEDMELIVGGGTTFIGALKREYVGMAVAEGDRPEFLVGYADGRLMRYSYDRDVPPPVTLRVYSLYESDNIRLLIREFRKVHPEITVEYEIGYRTSMGVTVESALENAALEMAAGTAADIFVMDDLPYHSYLEKGVLMNLTGLREEMPQEEYFLNVVDGLAGEAGIYTIPLSFAIPILAGRSEDLQGMETLGDLAQRLEEARGRRQGEPIINVKDEGDMTLLAQACQGAWVNEEGSPDIGAIREFLTLGKRIFDLQMEGVDEKRLNRYASWAVLGETQWDLFTKSTVTRRFGWSSQGGAQCAGYERLFCYPDQPFYAGYLSSMEGDFPYFSVVQDALGFDYCRMPGQKYGACLALDMMSVNSATAYPEECRTFLEYAFSEDFQGNAALDGTPVNRDGYRQRTESYETMPWRLEAVGGRKSLELPAFVPSEEIFAKLESLIENVNGVNCCEARVYRAVIKGSEKVAAGQCTVDEATAEIERKLKDAF